MLTIIFSTAIVLGILIFVHELGHFLVAKRVGVTVLRFSLGFGPKIFGITRGGTEYRLSLIPLGGYVKMLGEDSEEELPQHEKANSFSEQKVIKRLAIVFAGPFSNFLLAIVIFTFLFAFSGIPERSPEIGSVTAGSPAEQAGLMAGDRVLAINGSSIRTWEDLSESIEKLGLNPLNLHVKRDDSEIDITVTPKINEVKNLFGETIKTASDRDNRVRGYDHQIRQSACSRLLCPGPYLFTLQALFPHGCETHRAGSAAEFSGWADLDRPDGRQTGAEGHPRSHELHGLYKRKPGGLESIAHPGA